MVSELKIIQKNHQRQMVNNNFQGWNLVRNSTIILVSLFILILIFHGINEQSMRIAIRLTARTCFILFLLAFSASSLRRLKSKN